MKYKEKLQQILLSFRAKLPESLEQLDLEARCATDSLLDCG